MTKPKIFELLSEDYFQKDLNDCRFVFFVFFTTKLPMAVFLVGGLLVVLDTWIACY